MKKSTPVRAEDLERRELHLTIFACLAIVVLSGGIAILMYTAVFAQGYAAAGNTSKMAFFGFCGLSVLLVAYVLDRQLTIMRLRTQIALDRKKALTAQELASLELLRTLPNFSSFQDRLPMEYRRAASTSQELSILLVRIQLQSDFSSPSAAKSVLGDVAKAISRKLRDQDSLYLLQMGFFAILLPDMQISTARAMCARVGEGLTDVAGAGGRFSFKVTVVNYPENASTATELESAVCALMPDEYAKQGIDANTAVPMPS
jgi:GGDEF domain-containing protein